MIVRWGWESPWCSPLENKLVRGRRRRRGIPRTARGLLGCGMVVTCRWSGRLWVLVRLPPPSSMLGRPPMEEPIVRKLMKVEYKSLKLGEQLLG